MSGWVGGAAGPRPRAPLLSLANALSRPSAISLNLTSLSRARALSSTFERVAHSTLNQFRRSPAAARIAHQADTVTDAAARTLPPPAADPWGEEGGEDGPSTSSSSSLGGRHRRRAALRLVGWGDSPRHDHTAGGRYGSTHW